MKLIEIFLPIRDSNGDSVDKSEFADIESTLTDKFGGVTAYHRAPATGRWQNNTGDIEVDQIVIMEVVAQSLESKWWASYRKELEMRFRQAQILIRIIDVEVL